MFVAGIINPVALKNTETFSCSKTAQAALPSFQKIIKSLFKKEEKKAPEKDKIFVYLGGYPLGFTINCSGVLVVAISNDSAENLKEGDIITHIEGTGVSSSAQISKLLNSDGFKQGKVSLSITRGGKSETGSIVPQIDNVTGKKKLGIWIRDNSAGVGTMTYIRKDNFRFGALGHPVCDIDTGSIMPAANGNIFKCNIVGYKRGEKGSPGELRGLF
jgi:stage IV sporulation protein B